MGLQQIAIDTIHAKIHAGNMYVFSTVTTAHTTASPVLIPGYVGLHFYETASDEVRGGLGG